MGAAKYIVTICEGDVFVMDIGESTLSFEAESFEEATGMISLAMKNGYSAVVTKNEPEE